MSNGITGPLTEEQQREYVEDGLPDLEDIFQGYPSYDPFGRVEAAASGLLADLSAERPVVVSLLSTLSVVYWAATVEGNDDRQWADIRTMRTEVHRAFSEAVRLLAPLAEEPCGHGRHPAEDGFGPDDFESLALQLRDVDGVLEYEGFDREDPEELAEAEESHGRLSREWGCAHNLLLLARQGRREISASLDEIPAPASAEVAE